MAQWYVAQSTSPEAAGSRLRGDNSGRKMAVIVVVTMFKETFRKIFQRFQNGCFVNCSQRACMVVPCELTTTHRRVVVHVCMQCSYHFNTVSVASVL